MSSSNFGDYIPLRAVGQHVPTRSSLTPELVTMMRTVHLRRRRLFAECDGLLSQSHSGFWAGTDIIIPGQLIQRIVIAMCLPGRLMHSERLYRWPTHGAGVLVLMSD